jgi:hypothetical protein
MNRESKTAAAVLCPVCRHVSIPALLFMAGERLCLRPGAMPIDEAGVGPVAAARAGRHRSKNGDGEQMLVPLAYGGN